jgi:hypothetical protein
MKNKFLLLIATVLLLASPIHSFAWGKKGHELVAEVAFHYLDESTKAKVQGYLKNMSIEDAANWMDEMRGNDYYTYMRTWHYLDVEKGERYIPAATDRNIIIILNSAILELQHRDNIKKKQIKNDLLLLFHLMGDLHQPLHVGYPGDKGGNTINVTLVKANTNLHSAWDTGIIEQKNITLDDCLKQYDNFSPDEIANIKQLKVLQWMDQSRSLLDTVYNFKDDLLDQNYVDSSSIIIEKQILKAGLRLASVLSEAFKN